MNFEQARKTTRSSKETELKKLEYLERRGVATFDDKRRMKKLAREMAIEDFEQDEQARKDLLHGAP